MMPFRVRESKLSFPFKIEDHVAVTWKNTTIVWAGYDEDTSTTLSVVYCHQSGTQFNWISTNVSTGFSTGMTLSQILIRTNYVEIQLIRHSGEWIKRETSGDIPCEAYEATAEVIHDSMYVLGAFPGPVHSLDLNNWIWSRVSPLGNPPQGFTWNMTSWVYREKIYCFGGEHTLEDDLTNQLLCYNPASNQWEWPGTKNIWISTD